MFNGCRHRTLLRELEAEELQNQLYDIILCTCNETCSKRILQASLNKKQNSPRIAQCIVDECGMATEPETLAAISLAEHAVLIGDHKQLQPVVKYQPARQCGLGRSMFERYADWEVSKNDLVTLDIQYRMVRNWLNYKYFVFNYVITLSITPIVYNAQVGVWFIARCLLLYCSIVYHT